MQSHRVRSSARRGAASTLGVVLLAMLGFMVPASPVGAASDTSSPRVTKAESAPFPDDIEAEIEKLRELVPLVQDELVTLSSTATQAATQAAAEASAAGSAPDVGGLVAGLNPKVKELRPMLAEVATSLGHVVEAIVAGRVAADGVLQTILAIVKPLLSFVVKNLPGILKAIAPIFGPILTFVANNLATLLGPVVSFACVALKTFLPSFATVITSTCDTIARLVPTIAPLLSSVLKFLAKAIPSLSGVLGTLTTISTPGGAAVSPKSNLPETGSSTPLGFVGAGLLGVAGMLTVLRRRSEAALPA